MLNQVIPNEVVDIDYLNDDAYSDLNRTLTTSRNSRNSSGRMGSNAYL